MQRMDLATVASLIGTEEDNVTALSSDFLLAAIFTLP